ncbi:MAG: hypothetical protein BI182_05880 [Acetobacterium sp. MES1]|uniref:hypothetical protein n=1 Tax=Acetobacterium sp. MES1 TaxID=1899015 RepID=UPI000B9CCD8B|nr:hypothetical protein [Acetobacterium sp. MES1]OXS25259.1 MAG: hypothetical protein BI182_05880 [Acetobacterium sp. MES1]
MRRIIIIIIVAIVFVVSIIGIRFIQFDANSQNIRLTNVQINSSSITFEIVRLDSGFCLKGYKYDVNNDTLTIRFYGTMFKDFAMSGSVQTIDIQNATHINKIELWMPNEANITVWEKN